MSVLHNNPFLLASGNPTDPTFPLNRSVRLRSSASAYFNRTPASATNQQKWTWSGWLKRGALGSSMVLFAARTAVGATYTIIRTGTDTLVFEDNGITALTTTAVYRDPSAWYHIVISVDTTQATSSNRVILYVNGVAVSFGTGTYPTQNSNLQVNSTQTHLIGQQGSGQYLDGYLAEVNFIDGQALTPLSFGGYNPGTGVWEPRAYTGTYGTNGFYLPFKLDTTTSHAGSFNGTAKYISAPNNALFAQQSATSWTAEGWVYSASATLQQLFYYGNSTVSTGNDVAFGLAYTPGSTFTLFQYNGTTNTPITSTLNVPLGQWCHIAAVNNGGTITLYLNGVPCGSGSAVTTNSTGTMLFYVGNYSSSRYINGQVSNFRLVKGTAVYTSKFTPTISPLTAIANTVLLTLQDSTIIDNSTNAFTLTNTGSLTTVSATPYVANMSSDASGNNNGWIPNNINASTAGVTYDSMLDVPTNTGPTNANFAVLNPLALNPATTASTLTAGNLNASASAANTMRKATIGISSGTYYFEATVGSITQGFGLGEVNVDSFGTNSSTVGAKTYYLYNTSSLYTILPGANTIATTTLASGGTLAVAVDMTNKKLWLGYAVSGGGSVTWIGGGDPATGTTPTHTIASDVTELFPLALTNGPTLSCNFGQRPFAYTPPSGFKSLNTYNLPEPTIPRGDKYFKQYLYTGNGGGQQIGEIQKPMSLFNLDRSLRFRASNSAYLSRTIGTPTNSVKCTFSGWVKRGTLGTTQIIFGGYTGTDADTQLYFSTTNKLTFTSRITNVNGAAFEWAAESARVFNDPSQWLHIVVKVDTSTAQATNNDYYTVYVNGIAQTFTTVSGASLVSAATVQNKNTCWNVSGYTARLGTQRTTNYFDGYLSDIYFIDGQALVHTDFGTYDGNNYWTPKAYTGTYGTNGFHLEFEDYSASSATAIGKDTSGNSNNWTPSGINLTTPEADNEYWDSYTDVPTLNDANTANYCVFDSLQFGSTELRNGNLTYVWGVASTAYKYRGTTTLTTGKWYFEGNIEAFTIGNAGNTNYAFGFIADSGVDTHISFGWTTNGTSMKLGYRYDVAGVIVQNVTYNTTAPISTDIFGVEYDVDNGTANFYKNGTLMGSASGLALGAVKPQVWRTGTSNSATVHANFGQRAFKYTPSTGYKKINDFNVAEVVGDVETPDLVRIKSRSATTAALWFNSVSGTGKYLTGNNSATVEATDVNSIIQFNKNGLLIGNNANINTSAATYIADVWKAGETTQNITVGQYATSPANIPSIASTVRANSISGISVVSYTGNGNAGATVAHGLGTAPKLMIVKHKSGGGLTTQDWDVYHDAVGPTGRLFLNTTAAAQYVTAPWNNTAPTSNVFTVGNGTDVNGINAIYTAYCFAEIPGFSKFGSYVSNGSSTDGPFVYTGFRPRWVMIKQRDVIRSWIMYDTTRNTYNVVDKYFFMEGLNNNEQTAALLDINSNGFKLKNNNVNTNTTAGQVYVYVAFAENPFKYALAR